MERQHTRLPPTQLRLPLITDEQSTGSASSTRPASHLLVTCTRAPRKQKETDRLLGLGLKGIGGQVVLSNSSDNRGCIKKVVHDLSLREVSLPVGAAAHYRKTSTTAFMTPRHFGPTNVIRANLFLPKREGQPVLAELVGLEAYGLGKDLAMARENAERALVTRLLKAGPRSAAETRLHSELLEKVAYIGATPLHELSEAEDAFREDFLQGIEEESVFQVPQERDSWTAGRLVEVDGTVRFLVYGYDDVVVELAADAFTAEEISDYRKRLDTWCFGNVRFVGARPVSVQAIEWPKREGAPR